MQLTPNLEKVYYHSLYEDSFVMILVWKNYPIRHNKHVGEKI